MTRRASIYSIRKEYKQTDMLSKEISFAHYGRMIRSGGKMAENNEESFLENDDSNDLDDLDDEDEDPNTKFVCDN